MRFCRLPSSRRWPSVCVATGESPISLHRLLVLSSASSPSSVFPVYLSLILLVQDDIVVPASSPHLFLPLLAYHG